MFTRKYLISDPYLICIEKLQHSQVKNVDRMMTLFDLLNIKCPTAGQKILLTSTTPLCPANPEFLTPTTFAGVINE